MSIREDLVGNKERAIKQEKSSGTKYMHSVLRKIVYTSASFGEGIWHHHHTSYRQL